MPPSLAAFLTVVFVFFLLRWGGRQQGEVSGALWLPVMWMVITGSRFISQWINLGNRDADEGTTIDVLTLIIAGMLILGYLSPCIPKFSSVGGIIPKQMIVCTSVR